MSTARPAGFGLIFLGACFAYGLGCSSSSSPGAPADGGVSTAGAGGSRAGAAGAGVTTNSGGSGGTIGTGGAGGSGGAPVSTKLGAGCKSDAECGAGFTCVKSSDNFSAVDPGGPGGGLCSVDCTTDRATCANLGGLCIAFDVSDAGTATRAFCFEECTVGPPRPQPPVVKCHGRNEVVCRPVTSDETIFGCIPLCVTDADCGSRKCDPSSGYCLDAPMPGKGVGAGCTANRTTLSSTECAGGLCLPINAIPDGGTSGPGICTEFCSLGTLEACGFRITPLDAGPPEGACVFPWGSGMLYNAGDLGLCLQLCDNTADCSYKAADWLCRTDIPIQGTGHAVCLPPDPG